MKLTYKVKFLNDGGVCHEWPLTLRGAITEGHIINMKAYKLLPDDHMVVVSVLHDGLDTILYVQPYRIAQKIIYQRRCGFEIPYHGNINVD